MITVVAERKTFENRRAILLRIPEGTRKIEHGAFCGHSCVEYIEIPDGVTTIEKMAFGHCRNLKSINIPGSVISIHQKAFVNCANLSEVIIKDGVVSIGEIAFAGCGNLHSLMIPGSVTSIGEHAYGDRANQTIYAPEGSYAEKWAKENHVFRDGRTILNDVIFFTEHAEEWEKYRGRFYIGTNGNLYAFQHFSKSSDGVKMIASLIEATLKAIEPYLPKDEPYLPKES